MTSVDPAELTAADMAALQQDYDHFSDLNYWQRREEWKRRRSECPVSYSTIHDGFALVTTYQDAYDVLVDTSTFTSTQGAGVPPQPVTLIPEDLDPPDHRKYRSLINPALAPQMVATYESWTREMANGLLDRIAGETKFDVVERFARPLPQMVTLKLMGIPMEELGLVDRTTTLLSTAPRGNPDADAAGIELFTYLTQFLARKKADPSGDDMVSALVRAEVDGAPVPDDMLMSMMSLVLFGGLHTTTGAIAGVLVWLADHPEDRVRLREDPGLIAKSIDEMVRYVSPSSHLGRVATKDTQIRGCPVQAGQRVMAGIGSGNHDPDKFEDPDLLVLGRSANHHLGFGMGPHRCAGSHLAKMQMRVALEEFMKRYANFRVDGHERLHWSGGEVHNLDFVPLSIETEGA